MDTVLVDAYCSMVVRHHCTTDDILCDPDMMKQIKQSRRFYARGAKGLSFEDVFGEPLVKTKKSRR